MIPLAAWRQKGHTFQYRGHNIFYVDEGQGEALVCVHGFPSASWDWSWLWPELAKRFRVIACDMIGFGFSDKPRGYAYSLLDQATLHEQLLAHLGLERVHVLAHDYGDTVVQELLARHRENDGKGLEPLSVCLLNGGIFPEATRPLLLQKLLLSPLGPLLARTMGKRRFQNRFASIFGPDSPPSQLAMDAFWCLLEHNQGRRVVHGVIQYMQERVRHRERWTNALQKTQVRLALIVGLQDPISGTSIAQRFAKLVPNATLVPLKHVGHYPHIEAPRDVLGAVLDHLAVPP